jgi:hypothetical protein
MKQNASPAYNGTIAEGVNLTNGEVSEVALHLMADFSGEQVSDFIQSSPRRTACRSPCSPRPT